ncbi:hypothetical protein ACSSWA_06580 [Melioribacter sp. Ez-97]|uniref:hypothetical protein n=1 Tax=Melioribacter sp. Ez-97 TaxID=3423434 RepID=UPI003ED94C03
MNRISARQILILSLTAVIIIGGYFYFRYTYKITDDIPFAQEITLIVLGTVATVLITAALLNQQTAVEIKKEQSIKFLELKTKVYESLIDLLEEMSLTDNIASEEVIKLQFLTHRLAIVAAPPVLEEYYRFLQVITECTRDRDISDNYEEIAKALGRLTVQIRADLIGEKDIQENYTSKYIEFLITRNSDESVEMELD